MAQRTAALCEGKFIGIETIYTVINGKQINIPDKLKELREKSRRNELFCPCGCGANLILVAGDKNLREQHFREKTGTGTHRCTMLEEGKLSVDSRIALKCWLDDKLKTGDIESRVPIDAVADTKRKPEFTFLSKERMLAVRYWRTRANIMDDRLDVLEGNAAGIRVLYIVDKSNGGGDGQYPEALMKLQNRQGYCLLLTVNGSEYDKAVMEAVFYIRDIDGLWREMLFAQGGLKDFGIDQNDDIVFEGRTIGRLLTEAKINFGMRMKEEHQRRTEEEKRCEELRRGRGEKESREYQRQREEIEKMLQLQREETEKRRLEWQEKCRQETERQQEEKRQREEEFQKNMEAGFAQQETPVRDVAGNRWVKCEFCGKIAMESEFSSYGGAGHINLGTCKECAANNPMVKQKLDEGSAGRKWNPYVCPECGGELREKSGKFGKFMGCSGYPRCRYTRRIRE